MPSDRAAPPASSFAARLERARAPLRLAYVGVVLLATLSALRLDLDPAAVAERAGRMLEVSIAATSRNVIDAARNVVLFAGWGLLWMVTAAPGRSARALRDAVLTGAALSVSVECLQLLSDTRIASVNDLATNTGGSLIGALAVVAVVRGLAGRADARSYVGLPASVFALAYGGAALGEAFLPVFRQAVIARGGSLRRMAATLGDFHWGSVLEAPFGDLLIFLPAGVFAVAALVEAGSSYRAAAWAVSGGGALVLVAAEVAHGALGVEINPWAAVIHIGAVASGAWLGTLAIPRSTRFFRGPDRPRLLTGAYVAVLLLWALRPYRPEIRLEAITAKVISDWWVPLRPLTERVDIFSVVGVFTLGLLYLPLGALLAVWPLRLRGALAAFVPAVYLAVIIEIAQIFVATRTFEITNLMIEAAGAAVGWVIVRRAGFRPYGSQLGAG